MYLTKISARSLKGGDFQYDLTRANVLVGENFAGKTRVGDAIRLLLIGHLPELGKLPRATFGLACGPTMEVSGEFNNGATIRRRWTLKGDAIKTEQDLPGFLGDSGILTVMLNAEEYFSLSDRERVDYVFANCQIGDAKIGPIDARIAKVAPGYDFPAITANIDHQQAVQEFVAEAIEAVTEDWKLQKDHAKMNEQTTQGLTHLRLQDAQCRPLAIIDADRARNAEKTAAANERKSALSATYSEQKKAQVRRGEIVREINTTDKDAHAKVELDNKLDMILREIAAFPPEANVRVLFDAMTNAQRDYDVANLPAGDLRRQLDEVEEEIHNIDGMDACPTCGACGEGWKAGRLAELVQRASALKQKLATASKLVDEKETAYDAAKKAHDDASAAETRRAQFKVEEARCRDSLSKLAGRVARRTALEEERDRLPDFDPKVEEQMQAVQGEINVLAQEARALETERTSATDRAHDLKRLAEAEKNRDEAKAKQELAAAAGKELRVIQAELVEAAFDPLLKTANAIFAGVLLSPLAYRDGEIGTWRGGVWVGHRTMSGTEKALTYAAIQAALAAKSPLRVMLLDEMGRLTRKTATMAIAALHNAVAEGLVDQVLLVDPERPELYANVNLTDLAFNVIRI